MVTKLLMLAGVTGCAPTAPEAIQAPDCAGVPGGAAIRDDCGWCDDDPVNDNITCERDCLGNWDGPARMDDCGVCDVDEDNDNRTCVFDCNGEWGGGGQRDDCGVCDDNPYNDNSTCQLDCVGVWGGIARPDNCGVCDDDPLNDDTTCVQDCAGVWDGAATLDRCGVCDDNPYNDDRTCDDDCAGVLGGDATVDNCGVCDDDPLNDDTTCVQDCLGVWGGSATVDPCGVCDRDPANDCVIDCAGVPGGPSTMDACGVCDDDPLNDDTTCTALCYDFDGLNWTYIANAPHELGPTDTEQIVLLPDDLNYAAAAVVHAEAFAPPFVVRFEFSTWDDNGLDSSTSHADGIALALLKDAAAYDGRLPDGGGLGVPIDGTGYSVQFRHYGSGAGVYIENRGGSEVDGRRRSDLYTHGAWRAVEVRVSRQGIAVDIDGEPAAGYQGQLVADHLGLAISAAAGGADSEHAIRDVCITRL